MRLGNRLSSPCFAIRKHGSAYLNYMLRLVDWPEGEISRPLASFPSRDVGSTGSAESRADRGWDYRDRIDSRGIWTMYVSVLRRWVVLGVMMGSMLVASAEAQANWPGWHGFYAAPSAGWSGYSYSYFGGWDNGDVACCWPSWGTCYVPRIAPVRNLLSGLAYRWRAHHYGSFWGSWDPCWCGSSCCYVPTCCPSCECAIADCCCGNGDPGQVFDDPTIVPDTGPTPAKPPAGGNSESRLLDPQTSFSPRSALLTVSVPPRARIYVNGVPTRSTGELRRYVSRDLAPGFAYTYEVKAETMVDGVPVVSTKTVLLRAGDQVDLAFDLKAPERLETSLTVRVPPDARVFLAGNATQGSGAVRTFRTSQLRDGESWSEYAVRVVVDRDGEQLNRETTITLRAGDQQELTFHFDTDKVAAVR